jgi:hypothetical protein
MVNVVTIVQSTVRELAPEGLILSHPLATVFSLFNRLHHTWRWIRRVQAYSQNCLKVAAGYGLNFQYGDSLIVRVSAIFVMVATRILECVRQQIKLQNSWKKWINTLRGRYLIPNKIIWNKKSSCIFLSESTLSWWRYEGKKLVERICLIFIRTFQLVKNAVLLSVRIADAVDDAIEAFSLSSTAVNNGINEFFLNSSQWVNKLVENKELLIQGLVANKKVIETILKGLPTILTADQMIKSAEEALGVVSKVNTVVEGVFQTGEGFLRACALKWGNEFLQSIGGLDRLLPTSLPSSKLFWQNTIKTIRRNPKIEKVTKPLLLKSPQPSPLKPKPPRTSPGSSTRSLIKKQLDQFFQ